MSGALIQLVSKGIQDMYLISDEGQSFFRMKFTRHTNFSQSPKLIKTIYAEDETITIPILGDIINAVWVQGSNKLMDMFVNSTIDLYIGGQKVDSQHFDYYSDIWPNYLADTYTKSKELNTKMSSVNSGFLPLQFFFCNHKAFLPLVALQSHQVEIKIKYDQTRFPELELTEDEKKIEVYGNYIFLDKEERENIVKRQMDLVITQVQRLEHPLNTSDGYNSVDISHFNHPVKSLFFGFESKTNTYTTDFFTFSGLDIHLNGTPLLENMKPMYFHTIQNYYKSKFGTSEFDNTNNIPVYTRYYAYHFCMNASQYHPSGSCNFSRLDNAKLMIRGASVAASRSGDPLHVYAVNYNVLRIKDGLAGILFGN
jgi:hypothetical protein